LKQIERIRELTARLNKWRYEYYTLNSPSVTDAVYDRNYDELNKTIHATALLSLEKTKDVDDLMQFMGPKKVLLMHKLDGLTVKLEYENGSLVRASTRGNGEEGEVITHNTRAIEGIPAKITYRRRLVVVGECYIPKPVFERLRETLRDSSGNPYKNARNMAAGSIRCHDAGDCAGRGLVFSPFGVIEGFNEDPAADISVSKERRLYYLKTLGFSPCEFILIWRSKLSKEDVANIITRLRSFADEKGIPIDGIVVTYDNIPYSLSCGRTGHHYKDGLAFKFEDDLYETVLRGIEWTPSRSGELSPVALFDTVEIDGCNVSRASLHNMTFIKYFELMSYSSLFISSVRRRWILMDYPWQLWINSYPKAGCGILLIFTVLIGTRPRSSVWKASGKDHG